MLRAHKTASFRINIYYHVRLKRLIVLLKYEILDAFQQNRRPTKRAPRQLNFKFILWDKSLVPYRSGSVLWRLETYPWSSAANTVFLASSTPPTTVRSSLTANMAPIGVLSPSKSVLCPLTRLPTLCAKLCVKLRDSFCTIDDSILTGRVNAWLENM